MRALLLILMIATLSGCGSLKEWRENRKTKNDTTVVTTNTTNETTKTTITEKADTTVNIKGDSAVIETKLDDLIKGVETINNGTTVKAKYDPETGSIRVVGITHDKWVPIKIDKKTEIQGEKVSKTDYKSATSSKEAVRTKETEKQPSKGKFWWGFAIAIFMVLLVIILILLARLGILKRFRI